MDAGALRQEFFQCVMNNKLFEGELARHVSKQDSNIEKNFQSTGMMIGHSIIQGGPFYPCLCPAVSNLLFFGDKEKALGELPSAGDIVATSGTGIISWIEEVSVVIYTCTFVQSVCVV